MYYILWVEDNMHKWTLISGEDAMQIFVSGLCDGLELDADEIIVLPAESEIH